MKEMILKEFEAEIARGCKDWRDNNVGTQWGECGSGFCSAAKGLECKSVPMVREWLKTQGVVGVVLFSNKDMSSSMCGQSSCVVVGESKTYQTIEECEGKWLNDLPSRRQYAECFVRR